MTQTCKQTQDGTSQLEEHLSPRLFKALADPNRLALLVRLAGCCGPQSVGEVAACCPIDMSVVSRHLATLRDAGVLVSEKRGKEVFYRVNTRRLVRSLRAIADALERCCPSPEEKDVDDESTATK